MLEIDAVKKAQIEKMIAGWGTKPFNDFNLSEVFNEVYEDKAVYCISWGLFLLFNGIYYQRVDSGELSRIVIELMIEFFPKETKQIKSGFLESIVKLLGMRYKRRYEDTELAHEYVAFEDGLYNTLTGETQVFTPDVLCFKYIDVKIDDFEKDAPNLQHYLSTTLVDEALLPDPDLLAVYQEMCGALFSANKAANRAFFLYGSANNGKSITTELILSLFSKEFTASTNLRTLSARFGNSRLVGKIVNICSEDESAYLRNDVFKALVTGEQMDSERKNENGFSFHNFAKMIFSTNDFPKFSGIDLAVRRRIIVIPFHKTFKGDEIDYNLLDKLKDERAQFVKFALDGLKRLQKHNYQYTQSCAVDAAMGELQLEGSNVARYVKARIELCLDKTMEPVGAMVFYDDYREWCFRYGYRPAAAAKFAKEFGNVSWLTDYKTRPRGTNLYYVKQVADLLPPTIKGKSIQTIMEEDRELPNFNE